MFVQSMQLKNHGPTLTDLKLDGFKPVTVVYGRNGVGKTLISEVFRSVERNTILEPGTARLALNQEASNSVVGGELVIDQYPSADLSKYVRVFNKRFVSENVVSDNANPASIVLGSDNQELKDQIETASREVRKLTKDAEDQESEKATEIEKLREAQRSVAERVRDVTARARGLASDKDAKMGMFNVQHVVRQDDQWDLNGEVAQARRSESVIADLATTFTDSKEPIKHPNLEAPQVDVIFESARSILSKVPHGKPLPEVVSDPSRRDWLRSGLDYVSPDNKCGFCECQVPTGRLNDLKMAFTRDFDSLKKELTRLVGRVGDLSSSFASLPDERDIVPSLQDRYRAVLGRYNRVVDAVRTDLESIKSAANAKIKNLSETPTLSAKNYQKEEWLSVDRELQRLFDDHDETIGHLVKVRDEFVAGRFAEGYEARKQIREGIADIEERLAQTRGSIQSKNNELERLRNLASSRRRAAEDLTAEVQEFLGYREFAFELSEEDESSFMITRGGNKAKGLSEGETSALGLLYFLKCLDDTGFDRENGVVVIDDPVTSFDDDNYLRAYAAILTRTGLGTTQTKVATQVVVFTHNARFMKRLWHGLSHRKSDVAFKYLRAQTVDGHRRASWKDLKYRLDIHDGYQASFDQVVRIAEGEVPSNSPERPIRVCLESFMEQVAPKAMASGLGATIAIIARRYRVQFGCDLLDEKMLDELIGFANAEEHADEVTDAHVRAEYLQRTAKSVLRIMKAGAPIQLLDMKRNASENGGDS